VEGTEGKPNHEHDLAGGEPNSKPTTQPQPPRDTENDLGASSSIRPPPTDDDSEPRSRATKRLQGRPLSALKKPGPPRKAGHVRFEGESGTEVELPEHTHAPVTIGRGSLLHDGESAPPVATVPSENGQGPPKKGSAEHWEQYELNFDRWYKAQTITNAVSTVATGVGLGVGATSVVATKGAAVPVVLLVASAGNFVAGKGVNTIVCWHIQQNQRMSPVNLAELLRSKKKWSMRFAASGAAISLANNAPGVDLQVGLGVEIVDTVAFAKDTMADGASVMKTAQFIQFLEEEMVGPNYRQVQQWRHRGMIQKGLNYSGHTPQRLRLDKPEPEVFRKATREKAEAVRVSEGRAHRMHVNIDMNKDIPQALKLIDTGIIALCQELVAQGQFHEKENEKKWMMTRLWKGDKQTIGLAGVYLKRMIPLQKGRDRHKTNQSWIMERKLIGSEHPFERPPSQ